MNSGIGNTQHRDDDDDERRREVQRWREELWNHQAGAPRRRDEAACYIRDLLGEMHDIADSAELVFLAYLIEMAREEAGLQIYRARAEAAAGNASK